MRRKFFDLTGAGPSSITQEAWQRTGALYDTEKAIRGSSPEKRLDIRQSQSKPVFRDLHQWLKARQTEMSEKSGTAEAIRYALNRWRALGRFLEDGAVEIDNSAAERSIRPIALGRKNWLFAGSDKGGERAAGILSLIETAKLNSLYPEAYLRDMLTRTADHPVNRIDELPPWTFAAKGNLN